MKASHPHFDDWSPYLDRDQADPRCAEIESHLSGCLECREEVRSWHSFEAMFRSPGVELDVPPFQWQRIEARIRHSSGVPAWRRRLASALVFPMPLGGKLAVAALLLAAISVTSFVYWQSRSEQKILAEIARFDMEWQRRFPPENPFRAYEEPLPSENPFAKLVEGSR